MNLFEVSDRLASIRAVADGMDYDPEQAHGMEKDLWRDVLLAIADDDLDLCAPAALAGAALESSAIDFPRWYA